MITPVVCAIIIDQEKVMLAQRPAGKHLALKWEFPGGKIEVDETPEAALHRELIEELGCTVRIITQLPSCRHSYDRGTIELVPFVCEALTVPFAHEHAALAWVKADEIDGFDLAPADVPVVNHLRAWLSR
jgi:mutator protein MutT